jgi:hypothetical protein
MGQAQTAGGPMIILDFDLESFDPLDGIPIRCAVDYNRRDGRVRLYRYAGCTPVEARDLCASVVCGEETPVEYTMEVSDGLVRCAVERTGEGTLILYRAEHCTQSEIHDLCTMVAWQVTTLIDATPLHDPAVDTTPR